MRWVITIGLLLFALFGNAQILYSLNDTFFELIQSDSIFPEHGNMYFFGDSLDYDPDSRMINSSVFMLLNDSVINNHLLARFILPVQGKVISRYGVRNGRMHTGTDIKLQLGDTVVASYDGIVSKSRSYYGYGSLVVIEHANNLETYYAHLSKMLVKVGDTIRTGQVVGLGGRTGRATTEHLHFEIRENKKPYNPELVFNFDDGSVRPEAVAESSIAALFRVFNRIESVNAPLQYVVKAGDNLWLIARKFGTSIQALCETNHIQASTVLKIGSVLKLY